MEADLSGRYDRQLPCLGTEGQARLEAAHIIVAGAGGLGSPVAIYLAAAGVGRLTLVDRDTVDRTNLNRQVLHADRDIGRPKVESAAEKLRAQNPDITVVAICASIDEGNTAGLVGGVDIIIDATDNFPVRYILNRAAINARVPLIHGAVRGFDGQATTIIPGRTACFECIFPVAPPAEGAPPIIGTTAGIIGLIQANEATRYITGIGDLLLDRLLIWDGRAATMAVLPIERQGDCRACGRHMC